MKILITGSNGLTGQKIVGQLKESGHDFLATSRGENRNPDCPDDNYSALELTNPLEIKEIIESYSPDVIINTAAMTNVDACEDNQEECMTINVEAVRSLLNCCKLRGIHLVHLSTDFVFDGENGPYKEDDQRNPLSFYAQSKVDSEDILLESEYDGWSILRTIIVFGVCPNMSRSNIVLWARESLKDGKELTIVDDQFRAPTWADDLAWACIAASEKKAKGVYHISGPETMSIYDLVRRIAEFHGFDVNLIKPISSDTLNQTAKRPPRTGFDLSKSAKVLGYEPLTLEESLSLLPPI